MVPFGGYLAGGTSPVSPFSMLGFSSAGSVRGRRRTLHPAHAIHSCYEFDPVPQEHWDCDTLEEEGFQRFQVMTDWTVRTFGNGSRS